MSKIIDIKDKILKDYYESNVWDLTKHPNTDIALLFKNKQNRYRILDFTSILSTQKKYELKLFYKAILENKTYNQYTISRFQNCFPLIILANMFEEDSFLEADETILKELYIHAVNEFKASKDSYSVISTFLTELYEQTDERQDFERDIWHLDKLYINDERQNKAALIKSINFRPIINPVNRDYIKKWCKYLLGCTELSISTITNSLSYISAFVNEFENTSVSDIKSEDIYILIDDWVEEKSPENINKILGVIDKFYKYWEVKENSYIVSPITKSHYLKSSYTPADNLVSENVIIQIFRNLHTLALQERVMFLINYSAGLRISDVCQIKRDGCLYYDGNDGYYLNYYCQKMQKPLMSLIPKSLYLLIQEQQKTIHESCKYLFPSPNYKSRPMRAGTFSKKINYWIQQNKIINDDGTLYRYRSHAYRHTLATDLLQNYNVDLQVIQLAVLGHQEIQMSLTYAQRGDEYNKALHDKYINNTGTFQELNIKEANLLPKKALGNGYCSYPDRLGVCPYADACLDCEFFRTSKQFLDIHKKHLSEVQKNIITFEAHNWIPNLETAKRIEKNLLKIIESLENVSD